MPEPDADDLIGTLDAARAGVIAVLYDADCPPAYADVLEGVEASLAEIIAILESNLRRARADPNARN